MSVNINDIQKFLKENYNNRYFIAVARLIVCLYHFKMQETDIDQK